MQNNPTFWQTLAHSLVCCWNVLKQPDKGNKDHTTSIVL